jgi:hypothetical protein
LIAKNTSYAAGAADLDGFDDESSEEDHDDIPF